MRTASTVLKLKAHWTCSQVELEWLDVHGSFALNGIDPLTSIFCRRGLGRKLYVWLLLLHCSYTPCRTKRYPRGRPNLSANMRLRVAEGNSHSDYHKTVLSTCEEHGCHWWFENPDSSWLWQQRGYQHYRLLTLDGS